MSKHGNPPGSPRAAPNSRVPFPHGAVSNLPGAGRFGDALGPLLATVLAWLAPVFGQEGPASQPASPPVAIQPAAAGAAVAEEGDIELLELEIPVVVTAARRAQPITDIPYPVSVITAEDIRRSGARSVPDALRLVPGVDVADLSATTWGVSPRGFHGALSNQVLVLVDGRQIFDSVFGGTLWGSWPIQLEDIDHIEVIRGPGGVIWGANTLNGVINIITKDPRDQQGVTFIGGGGSRGMHREHLAYAFADERLSFRISGEYDASDGFRRGGALTRVLEDDYKTGRIGVRATYERGPDLFTLSAGNSLVDGGYPPTPLAAFDDPRNAGTQASYLLGRWRHRVDETNHLELTGYVNDFQLSPGRSAIDYRYQQFALQFSQTWRPEDAHVFTWGIDSRIDVADAGNSDPAMLTKDFVSTAIVGFYGQYDWRFAPRWTLHAGGRLDYEFYGGFEPSARLALSHQLADDHFIYGAASRSFQIYPAALRFLEIPILRGLGRLTADRGIDPQTVIAYELGYRGRFLEQIDLGVNLFWHEYNDQAAFGLLPGPPGLLRFHLDNRGPVSLYGLELEARYAITPQVTLLGNYTFQQLDWRADSTFVDKDFMTPPQHKFMLGARYSPTDDLHLSSHLYFVDDVEAPRAEFPLIPRHVDAYFRLDLQAEYEFWKDRAAVAVGVRNLLDSRHHEGGTLFLTDAEVPRLLYAQLRFTPK